MTITEKVDEESKIKKGGKSKIRKVIGTNDGLQFKYFY